MYKLCIVFYIFFRELRFVVETSFILHVQVFRELRFEDLKFLGHLRLL